MFDVLKRACARSGAARPGLPPAGAFRRVGALLLAAILSGAAPTAEARPAPGARSAPGALLDAQPLPNAPDGAAAYRVLYRSTGLRGEPIAVSGAVIVPAGPVPPGGRPIVAWAHPTTGVVDKCAPSLARGLYRSIQGLRDMLARGYIVAATDYPGLGTPGVHPYLVGISEGRAVLDSVRAARRLAGPGGAANAFAVWGHSQGGHAALFSGLLAGGYAPDLTLVGVAAAAPATELATLMMADLDTSGGKNLTAMTLWSWSRVYGAPMTKVVVPAALPVVDELANDCIETIVDVLERRGPSKALDRGFLSVDDLADREPWRSLLARNTLGTLPPRIPVFLAQGAADTLVLPRVTEELPRAPVPGRQPRRVRSRAGRRSPLHRPGCRTGRPRLDRRPLRRRAGPEQLRGAVTPGPCQGPDLGP